MTLIGDLFLDCLRGLGIRRVCLPRGYKCRYGYTPQCIANDVITGRYTLCMGGSGGGRAEIIKGVEFLWDAGDVECDVSLVRRGECDVSLELDILLPTTPRFVIDLTLWHEHTRAEKNELVEQIIASIHTVRRYLWDGCLVLSGVSDDFLRHIRKFVGDFRHKVVILRDKPPIDPGKTVMLDPDGDVIFTRDVALRSTTFIIGGIVDKERRVKGETYRLYRLLGLDVPRCKIELKGSIIGVPERINRIIEIILKVIFEGKDVDEAIIECMAKRDRVNRLFYELHKAAYRVKADGGSKLVITREMLRRLNWMKASQAEIELALKKSKVEVIDEDELKRLMAEGRVRLGPLTTTYAD